MTIYTAGIYSATVTDDHYVEVRQNDILFDRPGPWSTAEGAQIWAEAVVGAYHTGQLKVPNN